MSGSQAPRIPSTALPDLKVVLEPYVRVVPLTSPMTHDPSLLLLESENKNATLLVPSIYYIQIYIQNYIT